MNPADYRVRRATVDDLPALKPMWEAMRLPAAELEPRLTEFQVAEGPGGKIVGGWGFQIAGRQARIHSEAFSDFGPADIVRPMFWERLQSLTANHGVVRLWTQENTPFWTRNGFQPANEAALDRLPEAWDRAAPGWLTLQLKDEEAIASLEKEFALFMESEKQTSARALNQAKTLKIVVTVFAFIFIAVLLVLALWSWLNRQKMGLPPGP
jgi:hypothetical protein